MLVNFGNHPDAVGDSLISGDWPTLFRHRLEKALDNVKSIFFNGAQGDVNHVYRFPQEWEKRKGYDYQSMVSIVVKCAVISAVIIGVFYLLARYRGIPTVLIILGILLAMVVIAIIGPGTYNIIAALGILFIPSFARLVRGEFIKYRGRDFVHAARLEGVSPLRIIFVHILPNTWPVLLSGLTIGFNNAVLSEASMSFLGIGVGPADASLGRMLSEAQGYLFSAPWCTVFPALIVVLIILGIGMLGEGIRERVG